MVTQAKAWTAQFPGPGAASFDLLESKLLVPPLRPGIVVRTGLGARLTDADAPPIVTVVAPAGYGKTTLLAQWAETQEPNVAWVSLDESDNDPAVLLTYVAVALDRVEAIGARVFRALATPTTTDVAVVRMLLAAMAAMTEPVVLVLDQVDVITNPEGQDAIDAFATHLPPGARLALGSRTALPIPAARLRAQGLLAEVGTPDLAMEAAEAGQLLRDAGVECTDAQVRELVLGTEGWPTGLYLAAMGMRAGAPGGDGTFALSGDERFLADYLRSELLERAAPEVAQFVTRASVLDRMCGPLCDAVLEAGGSARMLDYLEARNLLLVPLDRTRQWFRFHHLFRDLLRAELQRREPELVAVLNGRAAAWCEANGLPETAIAYAEQAGDADTVARIVVNIVQPAWASGRVDTVLHWMQWLATESSIDRYPAVALHGALIYAMLGQPGTAEEWAAAAEQADDTGTLPDGNTVHASLAYLRALLCRRGIPEMRRDAQTAWKELNPASPYRATMLHTEAVSYLLTGDHDQADPLLARAFDAATAAGALPLAAVVLAERCLVAIDRAEWSDAHTLAAQALAMIDDGRFDGYWTNALVYAVAARAAVQRRDFPAARVLAARTASLRPLLTYALPVVSVQALLELARVYITLGDAEGAKASLRQVHDIVAQRPQLGLLPEQAAALQSTLRASPVGPSIGVSSLTAAELRLVPLLDTSLSFQAIGERLYISRNTVKTQAISLYRKLGVSSRTAAVAQLQRAGLLREIEA